MKMTLKHHILSALLWVVLFGLMMVNWEVIVNKSAATKGVKISTERK